ncbi:serine hydrolase domain-containing protein [Nocardia goodfellowii]
MRGPYPAVHAGVRVLTVGAVACTVAATVLQQPVPHEVRLTVNELAVQQLRHTAPSMRGSLFASRPVSASPQPRRLPADNAVLPAMLPWKGEQIPLQKFLDVTHTNSFVVLRHGSRTHQWYRTGFGAETRQSSWSLAKSVVSLLAGRAIAAGKLSEQDRLVDILPELASGTEYDTITIGHLLDMTSGVDVAEDYTLTSAATDDTAAMYLSDDLNEFVRNHRELLFPPGSSASYRSVDTQLLGMAVARVEGSTLSALLQEDIWRPIGAEDEAQWNLDHRGGQEKAFCCLNATARDFAKIGQLILDNGRAGATQVVPRAWLARIRQPGKLSVGAWRYSAQWWHAADSQELSAQGIYGQFIYVDPDTETVIVKLGDHHISADTQDTLDAFRAIARGE